MDGFLNVYPVFYLLCYSTPMFSKNIYFYD